MFNKIYFLVVLLCSASLVFAETVALNPDHPDEYVVQKGDTLWDISGRFLKEPWRWTEIWEGNPHIENPHLIFPGDVVSLVFKDGQPVLVVNGEAMDEKKSRVEDRNVKLSPTVRSYQRDDTVQPIPVDAIQQFLRRTRIVQKQEMEDWPYILSMYDGHLIAGVGDVAYIRGLPENLIETRYSIYRQGKALINQRRDAGKILGYEALYLGSIEINRQQSDPATGVIISTKQEILRGDRLLPESDENIGDEAYIPSMPKGTINANILSVIGDTIGIGRYQVVVIDAGADDGVEVGNILGIYRSGDVVEDRIATAKNKQSVVAGGSGIGLDNRSAFNRELNALLEDLKSLKDSFDLPGLVDLINYIGRPGAHEQQGFVELPPDYAGALMVFRVFDGLSYGLVMKARRTIRVLDSVGN